MRYWPWIHQDFTGEAWKASATEKITICAQQAAHAIADDVRRARFADGEELVWGHSVGHSWASQSHGERPESTRLWSRWARQRWTGGFQRKSEGEGFHDGYPGIVTRSDDDVRHARGGWKPRESVLDWLRSATERSQDLDSEVARPQRPAWSSTRPGRWGWADLTLGAGKWRNWRCWCIKALTRSRSRR